MNAIDKIARDMAYHMAEIDRKMAPVRIHSECDPDDAEYQRNVTRAMLRRTWGSDPSKWPDEERAWHTRWYGEDR